MTLLLGMGDSEAKRHGCLRTPGIVAAARRVFGDTSYLPWEDPAPIPGSEGFTALRLAAALTFTSPDGMLLSQNIIL